jgi:hypothetical protein
VKPVQFVSTVSDRIGRVLFTSKPHDTRDAAIAAAWQGRPRATRCSTCVASPDGKRSHNGIEFHDRPAQPKPAKPRKRKVKVEPQISFALHQRSAHLDRLLAGDGAALAQLVTDADYAAAVLAALKAHKYRRPVVATRLGVTSRAGWEAKAVSYCRWIANRDGITLPDGSLKVIWGFAKVGGKREQRCRAVEFSEWLSVLLPHWDFVAGEPEFVDLSEIREAA